MYVSLLYTYMGSSGNYFLLLARSNLNVVNFLIILKTMTEVMVLLFLFFQFQIKDM